MLRKRLDLISIKKYMEQDTALLAAVETAYRSVLKAVGEGAMHGLPATGTELQKTLEGVVCGLGHTWDAATVKKTEAEVSQLLLEWGTGTAEHLQQMAQEVKALFVALAKTADAVGARDQQCTDKLQALTGRLDGIGRLDDMTRMRDSILACATELKECVREIVENGAQAAVQFKTQIKLYEDKLEESEQRVRRDSLTKLLNRHGMESVLAGKIEGGKAFSLVMVDLDHFKGVNDQHGHLAGDDLLKQFADELKTSLRVADVIGRWGGDEFMVLLDGHAEEADALVERMRRMVVGDYSLGLGETKVKVLVEASFGIADYKPGESCAALIARADAAMYSKKGSGRTRGQEIAPGAMLLKSLAEPQAVR